MLNRHRLFFLRHSRTQGVRTVQRTLDVRYGANDGLRVEFRRLFSHPLRCLFRRISHRQQLLIRETFDAKCTK